MATPVQTPGAPDPHGAPSPRTPDPARLIPPIGTVAQAERMFRVNWVANLARSATGAPLLTPHFAAKQGRRVRLIDVRTDEELVGALGHIPGSDWIPVDRVAGLPLRLDEDEAVILISHDGEAAAAAAMKLEAAGIGLTAAMSGGILGWKDLGYTTTRDRSILERRDVLHREVAHPVPEGQRLTVAHIQEHVGEPRSVRWIKLAALLLHGRLSCVDGRDDAGVLGTPGGDAGELALAISAIEALVGKPVTEAQIDDLLRRRLDALGRFYMHTDIHAANHAIQVMRKDPRFDEPLRGVFEALEWRRFWAQPPEGIEGPLLEMGLMPEHIGCGHLRRSMLFAEQYGTRPEIVRGVISAYHRSRWRGAPEPEMVVLAGDHKEGGVLNVHVSGDVQPFTRVPLVSPSAFGVQIFVNHPEVASYLRRQLAALCAEQTDLFPGLDAGALHAKMESLAAVQLTQTLGALAKGLPVFHLSFDAQGRAHVTDGGTVA